MKLCFATDEQARSRFLREIDVLKSCQSPYILKVLDECLDWKAHSEGVPEFAYFVTEKFDGSLFELEPKLGGVQERLRHFREACEAVSYVHESSVALHRDIKPHNLFVKSDGKSTVLGDFGIALPLDSKERLTKTYEVVGSQYYRAPEVSLGEEATVLSEVYSLGRLLEWLLTKEVSTNMGLRPIPRGGEVSNEAVDLLESILTKATQAVPSKRFGSVSELLSQIPDLWLAPRGKAVSKPMASSGLNDALELARKGDVIGWQLLSGQVRSATHERLFAWRADAERRFGRDSAQAMAVDVIDAAWDLIALALSGTFSRDKRFSNGIPLNDLMPADWVRAGFTNLVEAPRTLVFIAHYLHGALCFDANFTDVESALEVALTPIVGSATNAVRPLLDQADLVVRPRLLGFEPSAPWLPFLELRVRKPELATLFPSPSNLTQALDAYSAVLSFTEFAMDCASSAPVNLKTAGLSTAPLFLIANVEDVQRAVRRTFGREAVVAAIASRAGASRKLMAQRWPDWKALLMKARNELRPNHWFDEVELGEISST